MSSDQVCRRSCPEHRVEGHTSGTDSGANRSVSRAVKHVVLAVIAGNPLLNEWVRGNDSQEHQADDKGNKNVH